MLYFSLMPAYPGCPGKRPLNGCSSSSSSSSSSNSTSLSSVMYMSHDSIVDHPLPASALCAICRQLASDVAEDLRGGFLYGVYRPEE